MIDNLEELKAVETNTPILIKWLDSMGYSGWASPESHKNSMGADGVAEMTHYTLGFLFLVDDDRVAVAQSRHATSRSVDNVMAIPLVAVLSWTLRVSDA